MLVPDSCYRQVADWVDRTHLRGRLVYFRCALPPGLSFRNCIPTRWYVNWQSNRLAVLRLAERELSHRFNLACCITGEQFLRETRAITQADRSSRPESATKGRSAPHR